MNRTLTVIVAASIFMVLTITLLSSTAQILGDSTNTTSSVAESTKCQVQIREAKKANDPRLVDESKCLKYIEDSNFETQVEGAIVYPIIS